MNIFGKLWTMWKSRHKHSYIEKKIPGEKFRTPVFLVEESCECGKAHYYLSAPWGTDSVNQTWARLHFRP